jgi:hypothetical protein
MSQLRIIAELSIKDYEGATELFSRMTTQVEEHSPGTLVWESFVDQTARRMIWYQEFANEQALRQYDKNMTDHGFRQEIGQYADLERVLVLGPVSDPGHLEMLRQPGSVHVDHALDVPR